MAKMQNAEAVFSIVIRLLQFYYASKKKSRPGPSRRVDLQNTVGFPGGSEKSSPHKSLVAMSRVPRVLEAVGRGNDDSVCGHVLAYSTAWTRAAKCC